jgi:hypothetical protein
MINAGPKKVQTKMSFTCSSIFSISLRRLSPGDRKSLSAIGGCPCCIERIPLHIHTTPIKVSAGIKSDARRINCGVVKITTFCRLHPSQMASFRNAPPTCIDSTPCRLLGSNPRNCGPTSGWPTIQDQSKESISLRSELSHFAWGAMRKSSCRKLRSGPSSPPAVTLAKLPALPAWREKQTTVKPPDRAEDPKYLLNVCHLSAPPEG